MCADREREIEEGAVIDRIVDGRSAVLLVGQAEEERVVPVERLPEGAKAGMWLRVRFIEGDLVGAELDPARTEEMKGRIGRKMDELRRRGRRLGRDQ